MTYELDDFFLISINSVTELCSHNNLLASLIFKLVVTLAIIQMACKIRPAQDFAKNCIFLALLLE
jgi:hypothetical protein